MLKQLAHFISAVFLPPFFPTFGLVYLMYINPYRYSFTDFNHKKLFLVILVFIMTALLPIITIMILRAQKMIRSISLYDQKERTIPYIASSCFYLWTMMIFIKGREDIYGADETLVYLLAGATAATIIAFILNIVIKISIHAMASASMVGLILFSSSYSIYEIFPFLAVAIILAGLIGMSRLILNVHKPEEVYWGYGVGFISQFLGFKLFPYFITSIF